MALCRSCGTEFEGFGESCSYICWVGGGKSSFTSLRKTEKPGDVKREDYDVLASARARNHSGARRTGIAPSYKTFLHIAGLLHNVDECAMCGCALHFNYKLPNGKNIDHIVEIADGGKHVTDNLQVLCRRCNGEKSARARRDRKRGLAQ